MPFQRAESAVSSLVRPRSSRLNSRAMGRMSLGFLRQAHSGGVQTDQPVLLEQRRHRADFPLRQVQPCRQLAAAHRLQRANAFQHQRPALDLLRQVGGEPFNQGKIIILHRPLATFSQASCRDKFCPA